jgi:sirohydrochlorin cobaltochelatase
MKGILLCGHGSRSVEALRDFESFVVLFKQQNPLLPVAYGFLELSKPDFTTAIQSLYMQGVREIDAIQLFLFSGKHIETDIPYQLRKIEAGYSDLVITIRNPIGADPRLLDIIALSVFPFIDRSKSQVLLTVGVGASVMEANKQITTLSEQISSKLQIEKLSVSFMSTLAKPKFQETLSTIVLQQVDEIIVLPLLLFSGVYYSTILSHSATLTQETGKDITVLPTLALSSGFVALCELSSSLHS